MLPHLDAAHTLARHLTRDPHEAEDAVQDAYLRAVRFFAGFRGADGRAWLLAIVRNVCYTRHHRLRHDAATTEFDETVHGADTAADEAELRLLRQATRASVDAAIRALPIEFREVLVLRELQELSYKEIGDIVGIPAGTVMSRLSRARRRLQRLLAAEHGHG